MLHRASQPSPRRLDQEVVVVGHETPGVHDQPVALDRPIEDGEEGRAIPLVADDRLARVSSREYVVDGAWKLDPKRSRDTSRG
jgi:hypothetical protein